MPSSFDLSLKGIFKKNNHVAIKKPNVRNLRSLPINSSKVIRLMSIPNDSDLQKYEINYSDANKPQIFHAYNLSLKLQNLLRDRCEELNVSSEMLDSFDEQKRIQDYVDNSNSLQVKLLLLHYAAAKGNLLLLKTCLRSKRSLIHEKDKYGYNVMHYAAICTSSECIQELIYHGGNIDEKDKTNEITPLICATSCANKITMTFLLNNNASVNAGEEEGTSTAIAYAIRINSLSCVDLLLNNKAHYNFSSNQDESPLQIAAMEGNRNILALLLSKGANSKTYDKKQKMSPLHCAVQAGSPECLKLLLEKEADIETPNYKMQTPLHLACLHQVSDCVQVLLESGANPNSLDCTKRTPIFGAIHKEATNNECLTLLLEFGANPNSQDIYGYTPLHIAALNENIVACQTLLKYGSDMTLETKGNISAFHFLVRKVPIMISWLNNFLDSALCYNEDFFYQKNEIGLDFGVIVPQNHCKEVDLISIFIKEGQKSLLKHPLCETFLYMKWERIKKYHYFNIFFYFSFVSLLTSYILVVFSNECLIEQAINRTDCKELSNEKDRHAYVDSPLVLSVKYFLVTGAIILMIKEVSQMFQDLRQYVSSVENCLQWIVLLHTIFIAKLHLNNGYLYFWQNHVAAFAIVFAWLHFTVLIGKFHHLGIYVQMFSIVAVDFGKFLAAYSSIIIAFSLSFDVLFNGHWSFINPIESFMTTMVMMTGEIEYNEMFFDAKTGKSRVLYPGTVHIIFSAFLLLIVIVLMNLLVGLAVSDINELKETAGLETLVRLTKLIGNIEAALFGKWTNLLLPSIRKMLQRKALLLTSPYHSIFNIRLNDPRDKRLPQATKNAILDRIKERNLRRNRPYDKFCDSDYNADFSYMNLSGESNASNASKIIELLNTVIQNQQTLEDVLEKLRNK